MTLIIFWALTFGLCFWAADAKFLGHQDPAKSVVQLRPYLERNRFFRELLSCYFCLGSWMGPVAHVGCWLWFRDAYVMHHPSTVGWWAGGVVMASLLGAVGAYFINAVILYLEQWAS